VEFRFNSSGAISMIVALIGTWPAIKILRGRKLGQQVRTGERAPAHQGKSGTPTMGGIVIIIASLIGYTLGHVLTGDPMTASGVLVLSLMTGLGFPDSYSLTPASEHLSFTADFGASIGTVLFVVWVLIMVSATSNGGEPDRRPGWARHRRVDLGAGCLRSDRELAVPQRLHHRPDAELLPTCCC
jgi:phospho-N-acetylmuramoyl-pentapeptide-transferase